MTIEKARQLLGKKYRNLTDDEIELHINKLRQFASVLVDAVLEKSSTIKLNETSSYSS